MCIDRSIGYLAAKLQTIDQLKYKLIHYTAYVCVWSLIRSELPHSKLFFQPLPFQVSLVNNATSEAMGSINKQWLYNYV